MSDERQPVIILPTWKQVLRRHNRQKQTKCAAAFNAVVDAHRSRK